MLDQDKSFPYSESSDIQTLITRIKGYAQQQQASPAASQASLNAAHDLTSSGNTEQTQTDFNRMIGECLWLLTEYLRDIQTRLQFTDGWQQLETERNATVTQRVTDDLKALTALEETVNQENHRLSHDINRLSDELRTFEQSCTTYRSSVELVKRDQALQAEVNAQAHRQLSSRLARLDSRLSQQLSTLAASCSRIQDDHLDVNARIDELRGVLSEGIEQAQRAIPNELDVIREQVGHNQDLVEGMASELRDVRTTLSEQEDITRDLGARLGVLEGTLEASISGLAWETAGWLHERLTQHQDVLDSLQHSTALAHQELARVQQTLESQWQPHRTPAEGHSSFDYFLFAQRFRGSRADVKHRQSSYTDLFLERERVLDLGCGRGEFLEILSEQGTSCTGIDADKNMVECCREAGLDVRQCDMFDYLKSCPENAFDGIFSAQVIEHLPVHKIVQLLSLCASKMRPGGILLLETVNPICPIALRNFYLDPTHVRPVHPELLLFLLDRTPFRLQDIRFSSPVENICADGGLTIPLGIDDQHRMPDTIANYQDYATIAFKPDPIAIRRHTSICESE